MHRAHAVTQCNVADQRSAARRVDTRHFKDALIDGYNNLERALLNALRRRVRLSHDSLIERYQAAEVEVNHLASTGEEVLALKRSIQGQQTQQENMKEEIRLNKATTDFLVKYTHVIPQDVRSPRC